jgi:hypothetical protein
MFIKYYSVMICVPVKSQKYDPKICYSSVRNNSLLGNMLPFGQKHPATRIYGSILPIILLCGCVTLQSVAFFHNNICYFSISKNFYDNVLLFSRENLIFGLYFV